MLVKPSTTVSRELCVETTLICPEITSYVYLRVLRKKRFCAELVFMVLTISLSIRWFKHYILFLGK